MRSLLFAVTALVAVLVLAAGIAGWQLLYRPQRDVPPGRPVQIEIPAGASTSRIGDLLAGEGVVRNALMFRVQVRREGADGNLRAGVYDLATGMPYDLVITKLEAGPAIKYVNVTIPEGFTVAQIAARLEKEAGIPKRDLLKLAEGGAEAFADEHPYLQGAYRGSLEGYLFPKTYRLKEGTTAREAVEVMLDQFDREIATIDVRAAAERGVSLQDLVTIASMIEREAQLDKERPLVSSVIRNRLARKMRLQICATIEYVLPGNRLRLRNSDLQIDSPYNTYRNFGLPPGPISNPGLASLEAAAAPADTDFIYYVLTGKDGSHTFAANESDFFAAKKKSKEVFGQ